MNAKHKNKTENIIGIIFGIVSLPVLFLTIIGKLPPYWLKLFLAAGWAILFVMHSSQISRRMTATKQTYMFLVTYLSGAVGLALAKTLGGNIADAILGYTAGLYFTTLIYASVYKNKKVMRKKIVAGNWKMNTTPAQGAELAKAVAEGKKNVTDSVDFIVCPPFTHLSKVIELTRGTGVAVGAQNCAAEAKGAYTGEVSAAMIASLGVEYVIVGHSERREYYGETSPVLIKKIEQAFENNLIPIFCVGEKLEDREAGNHFDIVKSQITEVLHTLDADKFKKVIVAYEPVWAIGTGKTASSEQAQEMHAHIREVLKSKFGTAVEATPILYGGSVNPKTAPELFSQPDVDGGLVGGASLVADDFIAIGKSFK